MHKADNRIKVLSFRPQKHIMNQKPAETPPPSANRKTNRIPPPPGRHFRSRTPLRTKKKPRRKPGLRLSMQRLLLRNGCNADVRFPGGLLAEVHLAVHQGDRPFQTGVDAGAAADAFVSVKMSDFLFHSREPPQGVSFFILDGIIPDGSEKYGWKSNKTREIFCSAEPPRGLPAGDLPC